MPTESEVKEAINKILVDKSHYTTSLNYAVNYCRAALSMSGHELKVQCLYILNNITHWRSHNSKEVRATLKAFFKRGII